MHDQPQADASLTRLIAALGDRDYRFIPPTPASHARVVARPARREARSLTDVLGWSLPFRPDLLDDALRNLLVSAGMLDPAEGGRLRARVRVARLGGRLYLHSAFPTDAEDAVFFGPDSYRFADLIARELAAPVSAEGAIVDVGTGAGVGAIMAGDALPGRRLIGTDINPLALRFAAINAAAAGIRLETVEARDLAAIDGPIAVVLANPPYIIDAQGRDYRDGGGMHGAEVALEMATMALTRLASGGRLILYTGSAIVDGGDALHAALARLAAAEGCTLAYREIDPDVFGEELEQPAYADVDRIAVVAAIIDRPA